MFQGSIVALVTPMNREGRFDPEKLTELVERHIAAKTDAIVLNGTTGEAPTLTEQERTNLIKTGIKAANKKIPIIVGTGTYSTAETLTRSREAMELGADACLIVTPYYNKPTQEGLFQHYANVAKVVSLPIIIYNATSRTACDILPETIGRLAQQFSNIVGVKDGDGDPKRIAETKALCPENFALFSGNDGSALAYMLQGGKGVISVTANVVPEMMHEMCQAALQKNLRLAGEINTKLMPLHKALFLESNPIPVKWALSEMAWIENSIRLPLTPLSEKYHSALREAMKTCGVL